MHWSKGYLRVFRAIFDKSKHLEHYKMMMGDDYVEPEAAKGAVAGGKSSSRKLR